VLNELFATLGIADSKPMLGELLLPPLPLLLLVMLGASLLRRRPAAGWALLLAGVGGLWLASTPVVGDALQRTLLGDLQALDAADLQRSSSPAAPVAAIVVLGSGVEDHAPEYAAPNLGPRPMQRLRYGLWLSRQTGLPVAFSGGIGHGRSGGQTEAEAAERIARVEFERPLRWAEARSRDTRENAQFTVGLLRPAGIRRIVVVTDYWHMPRSRRAFEQAIRDSGGGIETTAAPMGLARDDRTTLLDWLPSPGGLERTRHALHEVLGLLAGA
jgi:uncharacterized SAM-binding protein YcdF (DUF218 family)